MGPQLPISSIFRLLWTHNVPKGGAEERDTHGDLPRAGIATRRQSRKGIAAGPSVEFFGNLWQPLVKNVVRGLRRAAVLRASPVASDKPEP